MGSKVRVNVVFGSGKKYFNRYLARNLRSNRTESKSVFKCKQIKSIHQKSFIYDFEVIYLKSDLMVKNREFSEEERLSMYELRIKDKKDYRSIAKEFDCSPSGVVKVVQKIQKYGTAQNLFRSGRKRCTTSRTDRIIINCVKKKRSVTREEILKTLPLNEQNISVRTITNRLIENKFFGSFATNKPMISKKNRKLRLEFAKKYLKMPSTFWKRVIWSDEKKFELINTKRRLRVYKIKGEGRIPATTNPTVKHSKSIMIWGCVSGFGVGNLAEISTRMTGSVYVKTLSDNLLESAQNMGIADNFIFQQDNDPKHTSNIAKGWFADNNIEKLEWPPQSPDLSYIENLWDFVDRKVHSNKFKSLQDFRKSISETWKNIPQEVIDKHIDSIPRRLEAVIRAKGGNTDY